MRAMGVEARGSGKKSSLLAIRVVAKPTDGGTTMKTAAKVAHGSDSAALHSAELEARNDFESLLAAVRDDAQGAELHEVERALFARLLSLGRLLVQTFLAKKGTGRREGGARVKAATGESLPFHSIKSREYLSIFGVIEIERAYYWGSAA